MRIPHSTTMQRDFDVSMTPMIDVVFLLLIFFVCTASFQVTEAILPSPLAVEGTSLIELPDELREPDLERIVISISQQGENLQLTVNGQLCPSLARLRELLAALSAIDATLPVTLDIAKSVPLGSVIDVYDSCRLGGFQKIQFAAHS